MWRCWTTGRAKRSLCLSDFDWFKLNSQHKTIATISDRDNKIGSGNQGSNKRLLCALWLNRTLKLIKCAGLMTQKGTLRNYDGDGDGNFNKAINFYTTKQQLRTSSTLFSRFLCHCYLTTTWNDRISSVHENGNGNDDSLLIIVYYHFCHTHKIYM